MYYTNNSGCLVDRRENNGQHQTVQGCKVQHAQRAPGTVAASPLQQPAGSHTLADAAAPLDAPHEPPPMHGALRPTVIEWQRVLAITQAVMHVQPHHLWHVPRIQWIARIPYLTLPDR